MTSIRSHAEAIGVRIGDDAADALLDYLECMLEENENINLTGIRDPAEALVLHVVDSIALGLVQTSPPRLAMDLGTGNGFPGIAIKAMFSSARVILCDRTKKKVDAVGRAAANAGLEVDARQLDVAQLRGVAPELQNAFDLVTSRAVGTPEAVGALATRALTKGGSLVLWLSTDTEAPSKLPGALKLETVKEYELPAPASRTRRIAVWRKG